MKEFLGLQLPIFMPDATLGAVRALTTGQLEETGTEMIVVNTFHLLLMYGDALMTELGGIKKLMGWKGRVLSDSGGFQVYSLIHQKKNMGKITSYGAYFTSPRDGRKVELTPESSIDMQCAIGSDVLITLDDCRHSDVSRKDAEESVRNTTAWARRARKHFEEKIRETDISPKLHFAVIQGGSYEDLRKRSAEELQEIGFDGYCFGGWPINSRGTLEKEILEYTSGLLPDDTPKYAMGIGTPDDIRVCFTLGYKIFDCVLPTRNARHGLLYTHDGELRIQKAEFARDQGPIDPKCQCETCTHYSRAYVHHLLEMHEITGMTLATIHNLAYYSDLLVSLSEGSGK